MSACVLCPRRRCVQGQRMILALCLGVWREARGTKMCNKKLVVRVSLWFMFPYPPSPLFLFFRPFNNHLCPLHLCVFPFLLSNVLIK
ncbi:MAG: hypothetical protein JOS17DRAFT_187595 [Linnemannia elongata]|nr:MAG: hypothetical protein JOS17DRAFT_187595 [Linnemannia elongata]